MDHGRTKSFLESNYLSVQDIVLNATWAAFGKCWGGQTCLLVLLYYDVSCFVLIWLLFVVFSVFHCKCGTTPGRSRNVLLLDVFHKLWCRF